MKIITKKKIDGFAFFLLISGIGASWLTFSWSGLGVGGDPAARFTSLSVLYYYIFNSALLILSGVMLYFKRFKIYSILAILLGISVTISLLIFDDGNISIYDNLFIFTTFVGMFPIVWWTGGIILVPMFLWGVYASAIRGIQHSRGRLNYSLSENIIENQPETFQRNNSFVNFSKDKGVAQKIIPIIGIVVGLFNVIQFIQSRFSVISEVRQEDRILSVSLSIFIMVLSIFSLINKKTKVYRFVNLAIAALVVYSLTLIWIRASF
mgnify:FL=1